MHNELLLRTDYTAASKAHAIYVLCDVGNAYRTHPLQSNKTRLSAKYHLVKADTYLKRATEAELKREKMQDEVQALKDHPEPNETLIQEAKMNLADFEAEQRAESDAHYKEWPMS